MTAAMSGVYALILSGLALLIGQQNAVTRAFTGFLFAFVLLSAASLGADFLSATSDSVRSVIPPALGRFFVCAAVLGCFALVAPRTLERIDLMWITWSLLAISEVSSLVFRGTAFTMEELWSEWYRSDHGTDTGIDRRSAPVSTAHSRQELIVP